MGKFTNVEKGIILGEEQYFRFDEMFEPLEKYVPEEYWDNFMFMGYLVKEKLYRYKHDKTRNYINLDEDGNFYLFRYINNSDYSIKKSWYEKIDKETAFSHAIDLD